MTDKKEYSPAGEIWKEWEEAEKLSADSEIQRGTISVGCGTVLTIICCG